MALVKYGAIVSEARGKEAGIIFSRNSYGGYIKQKVSPVNPQTSYQQTVRAQLGTLAQQWSGLTDAEKDAWKSLGQQVLRVNRFGDQTFYTGFSLYVKCNRNLLIVGGTPIEAAPAVPSIPTLALTTTSAEQTGGVLSSFTQTFTLSGGDAAAGFKIAWDLTPVIKTGRRFVKNFYRQIGATVAETSPANILSLYTDRFGDAAVTGDFIGIRARLIHETTGFDGPFATATVLVTEL